MKRDADATYHGLLGPMVTSFTMDDRNKEGIFRTYRIVSDVIHTLHRYFMMSRVVVIVVFFIFVLLFFLYFFMCCN